MCKESSLCSHVLKQCKRYLQLCALSNTSWILHAFEKFTTKYKIYKKEYRLPLLPNWSIKSQDLAVEESFVDLKWTTLSLTFLF